MLEERDLEWSGWGEVVTSIAGVELGGEQPLEEMASGSCVGEEKDAAGWDALGDFHGFRVAKKDKSVNLSTALLASYFTFDAEER